MLLLTKYTVLYKENEICCIILLSLPSRERGLKYIQSTSNLQLDRVAPFAGAWIEIYYFSILPVMPLVAPFAGAWIEIALDYNVAYCDTVAPFAGAWIEMPLTLIMLLLFLSLPSRERGLKLSGCCISKKSYRRSLRGSVD